jgi:hypothetical protein
MNYVTTFVPFVLLVVVSVWSAFLGWKYVQLRKQHEEFISKQYQMHNYLADFGEELSKESPFRTNILQSKQYQAIVVMAQESCELRHEAFVRLLHPRVS